LSRRRDIWEWGLTQKRRFTVAKVVNSFDFSKNNHPHRTASTELIRLWEQGCLSREESKNRYGLVYRYRANPDCPPPGKGGYKKQRKIAKVAFRTAPGKLGGRFHYAALECLPVVRLQ
jgi:hypothetical protein